MVSGSNPAINVKAMNIVTEKTAESDANGEFSIEAKTDEMIIFPSEKYDYKRYLVQAEDFQKTIIVLTFVEKPIELDDVVVNRDINPEDLGLVPKGQKKYTVAERRLKQAGEFKPVAMIGMIAGLSIPVDPIINAITGRTKMLKKDVRIESRERNLVKLKGLYPQEYFTKNLLIPADYVEGFQYYAVDEPNLVAALKTGTKAKVDFALVGLAQKFNSLHESKQ